MGKQSARILPGPARSRPRAPSPSLDVIRAIRPRPPTPIRPRRHTLHARTHARCRRSRRGRAGGRRRPPREGSPRARSRLALATPRSPPPRARLAWRRRARPRARVPPPLLARRRARQRAPPLRGGTPRVVAALREARGPRSSARSSPRMDVLALVNVDLGPSAVLGASVMVSAIGLYQVRASRPEVSRDQDVFFSSVGLLTGGILVFQGWRLDPLMLFGQLLTAATAVSFASEAIGLRQEILDREAADEFDRGEGPDAFDPRRRRRRGGTPIRRIARRPRRRPQVPTRTRERRRRRRRTPREAPGSGSGRARRRPAPLPPRGRRGPRPTTSGARSTSISEEGTTVRATRASISISPAGGSPTGSPTRGGGKWGGARAPGGEPNLRRGGTAGTRDGPNSTTRSDRGGSGPTRTTGTDFLRGKKKQTRGRKHAPSRRREHWPGAVERRHTGVCFRLPRRSNVAAF